MADEEAPLNTGELSSSSPQGLDASSAGDITAAAAPAATNPPAAERVRRSSSWFARKKGDKQPGSRLSRSGSFFSTKKKKKDEGAAASEEAVPLVGEMERTGDEETGSVANGGAGAEASTDGKGEGDNGIYAAYG